MRKPMFFVVLALTAGLVGFAVDFNAKAAAALVGLAWAGLVALFLMAPLLATAGESIEKRLDELTANGEKVKEDLSAVAQIVSWLMRESSEALPGVPSDVLDRLHDLLPKEEKMVGEDGLMARIDMIQDRLARGVLSEAQAEAAKNQLLGLNPPSASKPAAAIPPAPPKPAPKPAVTGNAPAAGTAP